jgi:hypothetical protein
VLDVDFQVLLMMKRTGVVSLDFSLEVVVEWRKVNKQRKIHPRKVISHKTKSLN